MSVTLRSVGVEIVEAFESFINLAVQEPWISNLYDKFQLWAVNLGLLQTGHASLDWRLRNARSVETVILRFLTDLKQNLHEARNIIVQQSPYVTSSTDQGPSEDSLPDDDDLADAGYGDSTASHDSGELDQCLQAIDEVIGSLFKISTQIRNPSNRKPRSVEQNYEQLDPETGVDLFASYACFDGMFVTEVFTSQETILDDQPAATPDVIAHRSQGQVHYLIPRLLTAMMARRRRFGYLQKHKSKSKAAIASTMAIRTKIQSNQKALQQTDTSTYQASVARESLPATATTFNVANFNFNDQQTVVSISEYAPTIRGIKHDRASVPPPPQLPQQDQYFECPYCLIVCSRKYCEPRAWRSHVIRDLQPYICTYERCNQEGALFTSRKEWKAHEEESHRRLWRCLEHRDQTFFSAESYRNHIQAEHAADATRMQSQSLLRAGTSTSTIADRPCPICNATFQVADDLQDHIAAHLERIAIFTLPRRPVPDDDTKAEDESGISDIAVQKGSNASQRLSPVASDSSGDDEHLSASSKSDPELVEPSSKNALLATEIASFEDQLKLASPQERTSEITHWVQNQDSMDTDSKDDFEKTDLDEGNLDEGDLKRVDFDKDGLDDDKPDRLFFRTASSPRLYSLEFEPFSIAENLVQVKDVRQRVARLLGKNPTEVRMIYKGTDLTTDEAPIRSYGCKQHSEITVVESEGLASGRQHPNSVETPRILLSDRERFVPAMRLGGAVEPDWDAPEVLQPRKPKRRNAIYESDSGTRYDDPDTKDETNPQTSAEAPLERWLKPVQTDLKRTSTGRGRGNPVVILPPPWIRPSGTKNDGGLDAPVSDEPVDPTTLRGKLAGLRQLITDKLLPESQAFIYSPPTDPDRRHKEYRRISETIFQQVVQAADSLELAGDTVARAERKEILSFATVLLRELDAAGKTGF